MTANKRLKTAIKRTRHKIHNAKVSGNAERVAHHLGRMKALTSPAPRAAAASK
ncbi:MAG: hypothetical protein JWP52_1598 [Rhizobacter sp.]|jgi:hypothetical protein|nr:hypothetical protein [Rhizobacter sp.]